MAVNYVKIKNYKNIDDLYLVLNGQNTFFVGDTGTNKTTILDLIYSANMQKEFASNPLMPGKETGEVEISQDFEGNEYISKRSFSKNKNGRWDVVAKNGDSPKSLTILLDRFLTRTLKNGFFDYTTYFFELKSPEARFEYMTKTCGGEQVTINNADKKAKIISRREIGKTRAEKLAVYKQFGELTKEDLTEKAAIYAKEKEQDEAEKIKADILDTKTETLPLVDKLNIIINNLNKKTGITGRIVDIDLEIKKLQVEKIKLEAERKEIKVELKDQLDAAEKLNKVIEDNKIIEEKAKAAFTEAINEVIKFNADRKDFMSSIAALREYKRLDAEWTEIDDQITKLENENTELFKQKLPIPELGVSTKETDKEVIDIVTYNGREFSFENLSKGESISITARIQNALNPGGNNFIVIPEANLLGSKLDSILEECKKFKIQALVEVTQRKQEFKIVFEEEFLNA